MSTVTYTFACHTDEKIPENLEMDTEKLAFNTIKYHFSFCGFQIVFLGVQIKEKSRRKHNRVNRGSQW